jgi:serine protease Do
MDTLRSAWAVVILMTVAQTTACRGPRSRQDLVAAVRAALPAVVTVHTSGGMAQGTGSGFIILARDGSKVVVTNRHVIWGATEIVVELFDGSFRPAVIRTIDSLVDLAILGLPAGMPADTPTLPFGDDERLQPGESLISIGSPAGIPHAVSVGVVSARGKKPGADEHDSLNDYLFTDAVLSPGSSGGPVLNFRGEVVGVNLGQVGQTSGLGLVVPASVARRLAGL